MSNYDEDYEMNPMKRYTYFYNKDIIIAEETRRTLEKHHVSVGINDYEQVVNNSVLIMELLDNHIYPDLEEDFIQLLVKYGEYICDYCIKHPYHSEYIVSFLQNVGNEPDILQTTLDYYNNIIAKNFNNGSKQCVYHLFKNTDLCPTDLLRLTLSNIATADTYKYVVVAYDKKRYVFDG